MPIAIDQATVIFLYGRDACDNFENILGYWHQAIMDSDWKNVFFVRIAQEQHLGKLKNVSREFFELIHDRCINIPCDEQGLFGFSNDTLIEIRKMLVNGKRLYIQMVISNLGEKYVSTQAPVQVASYIQNSLGIGGLNCIYYLLVHSDYDARIAQRALAEEALKENMGRSCFYLLGTKAQSGGVVEDYEIWRALAYELLICVNKKQRAHDAGCLYSLGYTSLNANGSELQRLRRNQLRDVVFGLCRAPMSHKMAWQILMPQAPEQGAKAYGSPDVFEKNSIQFALKSWLRYEADRAMVRLDAQQKENFRILSDLKQTADTSRVKEAVKCLYQYNFYSGGRTVMFQTVTRAVRAGFARLLNQPNASQFPIDLMENIIRALDDLSREAIQPSSTPFPARQLLQRKDDYLAKCCDVADGDERNNYCALLARQAAEVLKRQFASLKDAVSRMVRPENLDHYSRTLDREMESHVLAELKGKYKKYMENIRTTRIQKTWLFDSEWVRQYAPFYSPEGQLLTDKLNQMISDGEKELRKNLDPGFSGTFIDTLRHELDTMQDMEQFLNHYMSQPQRMHFYIHDSGGIAETRYFVDDGLESTSWMEEHKDESYKVNNDNIEKICWYRLDKTAREYLADESRENEVFGTYEPLVFSGGMGAPLAGPDGLGLEFEDRQEGESSFAQMAEQVPTAEPQEENPRHIRLFEREKRFYLSFVWEKDLSGVVVKIGNGTCMCDAKEYNIKNAVDVTQLVQQGENHVVLFRSNGSVYGEQRVCGRQNEIRYAFLPRANGYTLKIKGISPGNRQLVVREVIGNTPFYYPVRNSQNTPDRSYDGLRLKGTEKVLETAPGEKFPIVYTKEDPAIY